MKFLKIKETSLNSPPIEVLLCPNPPDDSYIIIQEEAAKKYAGNPYGKECFRSLLLKPYFQIKIFYRFKNTDFTPVPNVNIVLLQIKKRDIFAVESDEVKAYMDFIAYSFNQQGKSLKERVRHIFTREQFKLLSCNIGFSITDSPVDLKFEQWLEIFHYYIIGVSTKKKSLVSGSYSSLINQQKNLEKIHRNRRNR